MPHYVIFYCVLICHPVLLCARGHCAPLHAHTAASFRRKKRQQFSTHTWFILRNINPQSELFASSNVEAQTVVIRGGEEMYDPAESAV